MERIYQYTPYFVVYSVLGMVAETLFRLITQGQLSFYAGFLHLPLLPIYGFGALIAIWVRDTFKTPVSLLLLTAVFIIILEFIAHWLIEFIFGIRIWDYRGQFMNLDGRISLFYSSCFVASAVILAYFIHPSIDRNIKKIPLRALRVIAVCSWAVCLTDSVITIVQRLM